jgi:hypothetical protein
MWYQIIVQTHFPKMITICWVCHLIKIICTLNRMGHNPVICNISRGDGNAQNDNSRP